jgi:ZIP family zinc transporter
MYLQSMENVLLAFSLTLLAGLSTGIGSAVAFFSRRTNKWLLSVAMGFSAGVMIYVSFVEILSESGAVLSSVYGEPAGAWIATLSFFGGVLLIAAIDRLVPSYENPHEPRPIEEMQEPAVDARLSRIGVLAAMAIAIHNFPEGIAAFTAVLADPAIGVTIAVAIAIHNIPEGIAISVPIYFATGNRKKAFWWSFLSGLAEPLGALLAFLLLRPFFTETVFGVLLGSVAGIMVFISLDELFPAAREYGKGHAAIYGLITGMAVMALSLLLLM